MRKGRKALRQKVRQCLLIICRVQELRFTGTVGGGGVCVCVCVVCVVCVCIGGTIREVELER